MCTDADESHRDITPSLNKYEAQVKTGADGAMSGERPFQRVIIQFRGMGIITEGADSLFDRRLLMWLQPVKLFDEFPVKADFHTYLPVPLRWLRR